MPLSVNESALYPAEQLAPSSYVGKFDEGPRNFDDNNPEIESRIILGKTSNLSITVVLGFKFVRFFRTEIDNIKYVFDLTL